jgi:hypothetical protein
MRSIRLLLLLCQSVLILPTATQAAEDGLVAHWNFDEGTGHQTRDKIDQRVGKIHGATWIKQGEGFALSLDGLDDFVRSEHDQIDGPVSVETWIKPMGKSQGEAQLVGHSMQAYTITYYCHADLVYWYIADGSNNLRGHVDMGRWNHVVGTFDGSEMTLWVNGRQIGAKQSKFKTYQPSQQMMVGSEGRPDLPRYKGDVDNIRVYRRALSGNEIIENFKRQAVQYGFDRRWFKRVKVTPYEYLDAGQLVVEADYKGLQPLAGDARIEVLLASQNQPEKILQRQVIDPLPEDGFIEVSLDCSELADGDYVVHVKMEDGRGARPPEEVRFSYPAAPPKIASPSQHTASTLPPERGPTPYTFALDPSGGFSLQIKGEDYPFVTKVSWPQGNFNHLTAGSEAKGHEASWKVEVQIEEIKSEPNHAAVPRSRAHVHASGNHYSLHRQIDQFATHVYVRDTYTNTTGKDLGLLIYNEMPINREELVESRLGGWERGGRPTGVFSPSVFVEDNNTGIGIIPIDDVYVIQSVLYSEEQAAGAGTEKFALAPGASYTLEWAVYPTGSGDYYDFINAFRTVEGRISTIHGTPGFITYGPMNRRQVPGKEFLDYQGLKYGVIHCLSSTADDPEVSIEGLEFMDFPKEMQLLKRQATAIHQRYPNLKAMFHVAHSLYCTNQPDRFADSKVISADGTQAIWGASEPYISQQRQDEGWTWWIYYPTPGNSIHDALLKSVDVMMDNLGMDGVFMDGFFSGYMGLWTYDGTWDGHSADIDLNTKTIVRKVGSVLLLSQPSMIEFCRKIRDKGGTIIANNTVVTRSIANEKYILHDSESDAGPQLHLAPNITALGSGTTEKQIYLSTLENLSWGELFFPYQVRIELTHPMMAAKQFPMTFEEIGSGLVKGPQRIVTMNSGVYGWAHSTELHQIHKFDARGAPATHDFLTTVDSKSVRSELNFAEQESAVIEPIPVTLSSESPLNARVLEYDVQKLDLLLHGDGRAELSMFVGAGHMPKNANGARDIVDGAPYRVAVGDQVTTVHERDGTVTVPLVLMGQTQVTVEAVATSE